MGDLVVVPLTPERFPDLAALFDEGGDPKWCWFTWFRFRGRDFTNSTGEQIGHGSIDRSRPVARSGARARVAASKSARLCFVVGRQARGRGIGRALLVAAIDYARGHGATTLEAYPVDTEARKISSSNAAGGTLRMFLDAGFQVAAWRQANAKTRPRPIVRRAI